MEREERVKETRGRRKEKKSLCTINSSERKEGRKGRGTRRSKKNFFSIKKETKCASSLLLLLHPAYVHKPKSEERARPSERGKEKDRRREERRELNNKREEKKKHEAERQEAEV